MGIWADTHKLLRVLETCGNGNDTHQKVLGRMYYLFTLKHKKHKEFGKAYRFLKPARDYLGFHYS